MSWTLLDFGGIRSRVDASEAQAQQALLVYEQTVQLALEETESALAQYTRNGEQSAKLESAARNSEEAARLARIRFEAGANDFLTVLDAERAALLARDTLVQAQVGSLTSLVDVYRSLGGGWGGHRNRKLKARHFSCLTRLCKNPILALVCGRDRRLVHAQVSRWA